MKRAIFVLGGPGSGKGTLCSELAEKQGFSHLSVGDVMRDVVTQKKEHWQLISSIINKGGMVQNDIVFPAYFSKMEECNSTVLADGVPRTIDNYEGWCQFCPNNVKADTLIVLDCDVDTMVKRIKLRSSQSNVKRDDESDSTIKERIRLYTDETLKTIDLLAKEETINIIRIDANREKHEVYAECSQKLGLH